MTLLILSFVAGVLTVAAPCILPLLPVIVGGSIARAGGKEPKKSWLRPLVIAGSLGLSVIAFTLLLKATTSLLGVPQIAWQILSGTIVLLFGLSLLWPHSWEKLVAATNLQAKSNQLLGKSFNKQGFAGDALIGLSLGPVFSSCSPTYAFIVASVLPASFGQGLLYLLAYALGLASMLLVIAYAGQAAAAKLGWLSNPRGWFKRLVGLLFIVVGIAVIFSLDKKLQSYILEKGWYSPIYRLEQALEGGQE